MEQLEARLAGEKIAPKGGQSQASGWLRVSIHGVLDKNSQDLAPAPGCVLSQLFISSGSQIVVYFMVFEKSGVLPRRSSETLYISSLRSLSLMGRMA